MADSKETTMSSRARILYELVGGIQETELLTELEESITYTSQLLDDLVAARGAHILEQLLARRVCSNDLLPGLDSADRPE